MTERQPNGERRTVLHVISGLFYGGGQRVVLDLLGAQAAAGGVKAGLCTLGDCRGWPAVPPGAVAVPYDGRYNSPRVLWAAARRLRQVVRRQRPGVLHAHGVDADLIGALAVRGTRARQVCHLHISPPEGPDRSWKTAVRRRLLRLLTRRQGTWFIAVSEAVQRQMIEYYHLPADRVVTVRNGITAAPFAPRPGGNGSGDGNGTALGSAGRLAPMKGFEHLLRAADRLQAAGTDCTLSIAGTGGLRAELEALAGTLGLDGRVQFAGQVADMPAFYRGLDVFVLPSFSEGLPLVVLEAMAAGLPVVATTVGGTPEAMRDGVDGLLVPPGDADALAGAIGRLAADAPLRQQMGEAGRRRVVEHFNLERVAREVGEVYERALNVERRTLTPDT